MKKVSIIIPVYNVEEFLDECLTSIENQTFPSKYLEVIIINDGSTDNSLNICKKYLARNKNWKLIDKQNEGLSAARNDGLNIATGEYVIFLDSDDYLLDKAIEELYINATITNADIVVSRLNAFNSKGLYGYYSDKYINKKEITCLNNKINIINAISVCGKLFKSDIINDIRFINGVTHEDNYFSIMAYIKAKSILTIPKYFYFRRIREGNNPSIMQQLSFKTYCDLLINYKQIFLDKNVKKFDNLLVNFLVKSAIRYIISKLSKKDYKTAINELKKFLAFLTEKNVISKQKQIYYIFMIWFFYTLERFKLLFLKLVPKRSWTIMKY